MRRRTERRRVWSPLLLVALACAPPAQDNGGGGGRDADPCTVPTFGAAESIAVQGYADTVSMEPFLTRDGQYLLFNNSNAPSNDTDLQVARRDGDTSFTWLGELEEVDSNVLDGVPSVDVAGNLYFVSVRSYGTTLSTVYTATFEEGSTGAPNLVQGIAAPSGGIVTFDAEISADGETLYLVDGDFSGGGAFPGSGDILQARKTGDGAFERVGDAAFENINSEALEYAPAFTADELELYFTRIDTSVSPLVAHIWVAVRGSRDDPFCAPVQVEQAEGFVEGPTLSADDNGLVFHRESEGGGYHLERVAIQRP